MRILTLPFPDIDPILVQLGPFAIHWYALGYIGGILFGWFYARAICQARRLWDGPAPINRSDIDDFVVWITLGVILGGRTGYVLFYNPTFFARDPISIVELWKGGMSFHGGVGGCIAAILLFARKRKLPILTLGDIVCAVAPIGIFLVRIGNFINGELWGRPSNLPWAVVFPDAGSTPRHPSQLYEAGLEGIVLFIALALLIRAGALKRPGLIVGAFMLGYGVVRCFSELFREPDAQLGFLWGGLTMGMLLTLPMIVAGSTFLFNAIFRHIGGS
jgi:phosphatidylglycerol:prolipoprotein diacylglycerol transferase